MKSPAVGVGYSEAQLCFPGKRSKHATAQIPATRVRKGIDGFMATELSRIHAARDRRKGSAGIIPCPGARDLIYPAECAKWLDRGRLPGSAVVRAFCSMNAALLCRASPK